MDQRTDRQTQLQNNDQKENIPALLRTKHPLQHSWTFWYYKNDKNRMWNENLLEVKSFSTIEDFWAIYNHVKLVSTIAQGCDYCLFKEKVKPMWEEPKNVNGGRWVLTLNRHDRFQELDNLWLELLLCLIGEGFNENSDMICGGVVNVRPKGDKISLWTADANAGHETIAIGRIMKQRLFLSPNTQLAYFPHVDNVNRRGSVIKAKYSV